MAGKELKNGSERREYPRHVANIQVKIRIGSETADGSIIDISLEGLRISAPRRIKPSTDVVISFSTGKEVSILARVVWTLDKIAGGLPSYLAGLKIYSISVNKKDVQSMAERVVFIENLLA